ncbi:hypothetical protein [Anabaena azotica]|uniref:Uncharacterized protein n=1 Tax=Anabaena azotica FACHB-119 TaxID=947527 RepID=A0ABR8CZV8_9NOST|nr:hypothetical protein [Anabaena azotica]MBD2500474.1 hypothetical protein [Anabaena azotica FACHB-119]
MMDIVAPIVSLLAPHLPFLLNVGGKVAEGAYQQAGADAWDTVKAIWGKLKPKVEAKEAAKEAAIDLAGNPDDKALQTVLQVQLQKILSADTVLAEELAQILQTLAEKSGDNIQMGANAYDQSTVKQVGKIEANEVSF